MAKAGVKVLVLQDGSRWYFENFDGGAYFGNVPLRQYFLLRIRINLADSPENGFSGAIC